MTEHEWRERAEGGPRLFSATRFAKRWQIRTRLKSEPFWTLLEAPYEPAVLKSLREILWAKYQRKRLPFEVVHEIDRQLSVEERRTTDEKDGGLVPRT